MDLTRLAIEKNRIFGALLLFVLVAGVIAYQGMPRSEDPGFVIRTALVQTFFPGASPERVEMLVTDKLEKVIQEIPEIDFLRSQSKVGVSLIFVNIREEYADMRPIWDNLRRKVEKALTDLPEGVVGPFVNDEFGDVFGSLIAVTGDGFDDRELKDIADEVRDELLLLDQVAKVEIVGSQNERIFVVFDNARLAELGLSPTRLQQELQLRNIVLPGGDVTTSYEKIVLEPTGNFQSLDEIRGTVISVPGSNSLMRIEDVLTIERGYVDPPETKVRFNGEPALILAVSLREGGNILELGEDIRQVVSRARSVYPIGVEFELLQFQADAVARKIDTFIGNLSQAVVFVALIMLVFLGLRTGLIVASLIPTTIIVSFFLMSAFGIGLDQMSLAALIIALGMLVDNAIVMSESIMVQASRGVDTKTAALTAARELRVPLLTSSLTTAAAFLPIFLAETATGEYTAPIFKVVTITLLTSWTLALTLIPMLCVRFLKVSRSDPSLDRFGNHYYEIYRRVLLALLRHPWRSLAGIAVVFVLALQGMAFVPQIFYPPNDRPTFTVELDLPVGSPIERTDEVVRQIESFIAENWRVGGERERGVVSWGAFIGEGPPRFMLTLDQEQRSPNYAYLLANVNDAEALDPQMLASIARFVEDNFPDANVTVRKLPLGPPAWPPVAIRVSGRDTERLFEIVEQVKAELRDTPGARQISDDWGPRSKKVVIEIDEARARRAGVTHRDIALSLQSFLSGIVTTEFRENDELIPVVLRSREDQRTEPDRIATMNVYSAATGESVPLSQVAYPRLQWEPGLIERRNRLRTVTVEALLQPGFTVADVTGSIAPWLQASSESWPFGFGWEFGGETETSGKANASILAKLPIAAMIIALLLIAQFNSIRRPVIILLTIPLALIGVVVGLLTARSYFGFMTLLGVISLSGIVINNAIVLLDRIRIEIEINGLAPAEAIVSAAQQRLRPILLTMATTVGGLLPLWFGGGPMWEPMAIAIIFGLVFATFLTLGAVPVLYAMFFRVSFSAPGSAQAA